LDRISTSHKIGLSSRDGHSAWLNSAALEELKITKETPQPAGGKILINDQGELQGILLEKALEPFYKLKENLPLSSHEISQAFQELYSYGLTAFHSFEGPKEFRLLQDYAEKNGLESHIWVSLPIESLSQIKETGFQSGFGGRIQFWSLKVFADGALGSRTAWMKAPYDGSENWGMAVTSKKEMVEFFSQALSQKIALSTHAIGDGAVEAVIQGFLEAKKKATNLEKAKYCRIEHCQHISLSQIPLLAQAGLVASMQPCHLLGDYPNIQRFLSRRQKEAYPFRSLLKKKILLSFGSDAPIEPPVPFRNFYAALCRNELLEGQESISIIETLKAHTLWAAQSFGNPILGRIQSNCKANLVVVPGSFSKWRKEDFLHQKPAMVILEGKIQYCHSQLSEHLEKQGFQIEEWNRFLSQAM
ncbi:MAG: hypothetical protein D6785_07125, partial [Planctomycetota bacterium]